ncbi:MAG: hypothetical protein KBA32_02855, partial [Propionivibrio sp.]|nr:hypothetical protein [Propionivibrio sp.]
MKHFVRDLRTGFLSPRQRYHAAHSSMRQRPKTVDESDLLLSRLIDEEYTRHPFYGSRKMVIFLETVGH